MQVFIFGAARTKSKISEHTVRDDQLILEKIIKGQRVLDWTLQGLKEAGISSDSISFIGGYQIEKIIYRYPELHYTVNPKWAETHVVGSLRYAMESWKGGDLLLMYGDTVFRPSVFKKILQLNNSVTIGIDTKWKQRLTNEQFIGNAEKVIIGKDKVKKIGRTDIKAAQADAQFSGLVYLKKGIAKKIYNLLQANHNTDISVSDNDSLTNLLNIIHQKWETPLSIYDHSGLWAELDTHTDLAKFVFGTKAETLQRIRPFLKSCRVCKQVHFELKEWEKKSPEILKKIQKKFSDRKLIIRSSSLEEDSWESSQAGAFLSVADVNANYKQDLKKAIEDVISGFRQNGSDGFNPNNQILVQPFISDVAMSGVAFSKHLENGTPYYLVNYDDVTNRTDTVTSGSTSHTKSITIYKKADTSPKDKRITHVIEAVDELEAITGYSSIDVEFVLTNADELYIVQVRPITTHAGLSEISDFSRRINEAKNKVSTRFKNYSHIYGDTSILADMPDWNPAEMIGIRPNPLAVSLYQYLITDSAWRIARAKMGYHNPAPEKLLYCIGGHPYIDVRNSFNNLIPNRLDPDLADKLVNHYIKRLKENPQLHDKVEFEIVITCFTPDIENHIQRLKDDAFTEAEINQLKDKLRDLTEEAITGEDLSVKKLVSHTESLNERRELLLDDGYEIDEIPSLVQILLDDCIERGTIPFSILARYGFIASSMLRGLVTREVISEAQKDAFLRSVETVAGKLIETMDGVLSGTYSKDKFLREYGHLRPGSYDITSYSYNERPEQYFPISTGQSEIPQKEMSVSTDLFTFSKNVRKAIGKEIDKMEMDFSAEQLLKFIKDATAAREYAKFQFTKNLSKILNLLVEWGNEYGFSRKEISYLFIDDILRLNKFTIAQEARHYIENKIQEGKRWHRESNTIETPQIILSSKDLDIILHNVADPNYVTNNTVTAPICDLSTIKDKTQLKGKIILTEGADPGFDWIFMHPIRGLVTKYGGAASHMTIRCAEFGLPAAIGCGEEWYNRLKKASNVELNCLNKQLKILG